MQAKLWDPIPITVRYHSFGGRKPSLWALRGMGVEILPGRGLDFLDPWGNHWQVVDYSEIQFTKAPEILKGMGLEDLKKSKKALEELRKKGLAPLERPKAG